MAAHSEPDFTNPFRRNRSDRESSAERTLPPGPVPPGPVSPGPVPPGPVSPGPVSPGPVSPGPVSPGPVSPGPVSPGPEPPAPLRYEPGAWHYDMAGDKLLHVFNHHRYQKTRFFRRQPAPRPGTQRDVARLTAVFASLGFRCAVHHDKTHEQILEIVSKLSAQDHVGTSCVCVAVLTHGSGGGEVLAADRPYELRDVVTRLQLGHAGLVGKPKLVVVQACRGDALDAGRVALDQAAHPATVATHADTLLLTSSVEDFVSWRDANGSWLIQELCRVLESTHRDLDFLQMTTLVTSLVARERASNTPSAPAQHRMKQTPETRSTLTKLLRFSLAQPPTPDPL